MVHVITRTLNADIDQQDYPVNIHVGNIRSIELRPVDPGVEPALLDPSRDLVLTMEDGSIGGAVSFRSSVRTGDDTAGRGKGRIDLLHLHRHSK